MKITIINKRFTSIWVSNFLSIVNGRFRELIIPLIVLGLTGSTLTTALVALSQRMGTILFAIPIGTWVESKNKINVKGICHILYGVCIFIMAYLITIDNINSAMIAFLLFIMGILALISQTAFATIIPHLSGRKNLLKAHTSLEAADAIATLAAPAIGGFIFAQTGSSFTLIICGVLSFFSAFFTLILRSKSEQTIKQQEHTISEKVKNFSKKSMVGFKCLVANQAQIINTIVICVLAFSTLFIVLTIIFHARVTLELSETYIGILLSFAGVGNIIGVLIMNKFKNFNWLYLMSSLLIISSMGVLLIYLSDNFIIMCLGMAIFDGALSMGFVVQGAVHQGITPNNYLARVKSATYVISGIFTALATLLSGAIPEYFTTHDSLLIGVLFLLIPALFIGIFFRNHTQLSRVQPIEIY